MTNKLKSRKERGKLPDTSAILTDKYNIPTSPDRLNFLDRFPRLRVGMDQYVLVCAVRLRIADLSDSIIPDSELTDLPHSDEFFGRYFSRKSQLEDFKDLREVVRRLDKKAIVKATAATMRIGQIVIHQDHSESHESTWKWLRMMAVVFAHLIMFFNRRSEARLKVERMRLKKNYQHYPIFKDILRMIMDFDKRIEGLLALQNGNDFNDHDELIESLATQAQALYRQLLIICSRLEIVVFADQNPELESADDLDRNLIAMAIEAEEMLKRIKRPDVTLPLQAAAEVVDPVADFNARLRASAAKRGQVIEAEGTSEDDILTAGELQQKYDYEEAQRRKV